MVPDNKVTVKGLTEGKPYEFRVAAVNEAGPGEYAETKEAIKPAPPPSQSTLIVFSALTTLSAYWNEIQKTVSKQF